MKDDGGKSGCAKTIAAGKDDKEKKATKETLGDDTSDHSDKYDGKTEPEAFKEASLVKDGDLRSTAERVDRLADEGGKINKAKKTHGKDIEVDIETVEDDAFTELNLLDAKLAEINNDKVAHTTGVTPPPASTTVTPTTAHHTRKKTKEKKDNDE